MQIIQRVFRTNLLVPLMIACSLLSIGPHVDGQREHYGVVHYAGAFTAPVLYAIDTQGSVRATLATFPSDTYPWSAVMSNDNATIRGVAYGMTPTAPPMIFDVTPNGLTTIHAGPPLVRPSRILPTSDGDWLVYDTVAPQVGRFFRFSGGRFSTMTTIPGHVYGIKPDPDLDGMWIRAWVGTPPVRGLFRLDPATSALTTMWWTANTRYMLAAAHELIIDPRTNAVIDLHYTDPPTSDLSRYDEELGRRVLGTTRLGRPIGLTTAEQTSGASLTALVDSWTAIEIVQMRLDGSQVRRAPVTGITPGIPTPFFRIGGRHLAWRMRNAPNHRELRIAVPHAPRKPYVVALSLTGSRPGLPIGGRVLPLVADALTNLCVRGGIPGWIGPTVGRLDNAGRARIAINADPVRQALRGRLVWAAAVILDPSAPAGISHILGPERFRIR